MTTMTPTPATRATPPKTRWWKRPWVVPLFFIATVFLAFSVPRYLTFDPANSFIAPPEWFPPYYGFLVAHVLFASVAMITCCMQIWPWLRQRHPKVHRISGRIYVFAGVIPAGICALGLAWGSAFGLAGSMSTFVMAPIWMAATIVGIRMARQRRFGDHRRWMIRSFALTMSIVANRFIGVPFAFAFMAQKDTVFHGDEVLVAQATGGVTAWLGWTICLLIAEWWLIERGSGAKHRARKSKRDNESHRTRPSRTAPVPDGDRQPSTR